MSTPGHLSGEGVHVTDSALANDPFSISNDPPPSLHHTVTVVSHPGSGMRLLACVARRTYQYTPQGKVSLAPYQPYLTLDPVMSNTAVDALATLDDDTDLLAPKELTDIVVRGSACARKKTKEMFVAIALGKTARRLRVTGERRAEVAADGTVKFTAPEPFERVTIEPRAAYGGYDEHAQDKLDPALLHNIYILGHKPTGIFAYPRNSAGAGYYIDLDRPRADGARLPQIEDPSDALTPDRFFVPVPEAWLDAPVPGMMGWMPHSSYPRLVRYIGDRFPHLPPLRKIREIDLGCGDDLADIKPLGHGEIHPRALQGASPGLARERLRGDELGILQGLDPDADEVRFSLPGEGPRFGLVVPDIKKVFGPKAVLQTVRIDTDRREISLTWCATVPLLGRPQQDLLDLCELQVEWGRI